MHPRDNPKPPNNADELSADEQAKVLSDIANDYAGSEDNESLRTEDFKKILMTSMDEDHLLRDDVSRVEGYQDGDNGEEVMDKTSDKSRAFAGAKSAWKTQGS